MSSKKMQHGALLTREAYSALLNLRSLVELAVDKTRSASMQTVGLAINAAQPTENFLSALRIAADTLESSAFRSALSDAQSKIGLAIAWYEELEGVYRP